jgi:2'-5' RNA ligase
MLSNEKTNKTAEKLPQHHSTEFQGIPIVLEWPKGTTRTGVDDEGKPWKREMMCDYGYVEDTTATGDSEALDVYIGDSPDAEKAYVVEQLDDEGELDEYKVMLGFNSLQEAEAMYLKHYPDDWEDTNLGEIAEVDVDYLFDRIKQHQNTQVEPDAKPQFGLVMLIPPQEIVNAMLDLNESIADEDLAGDGREDHPHITVRYGINTDDVKKIEELLAKTASFSVKLEKTGVFPPSKSSDGAAVVYISASSPELSSLHAALGNTGCFKPSDFPDYKPHMTLAYVKTEVADKYAGLDVLQGQEFKVTSLTISDKNKVKTEVTLGESKAASTWSNYITARLAPMKKWKQVVATESQCYWISILKHKKFFGVLIVEAADAHEVAAALGKVGVSVYDKDFECQAVPFDRPDDPSYCNRLLNADEARALGGKRVGDNMN